eukprot:GFUD01005789.1.p1 GENE.GFUD01005789.1~~GFUD01005789.1.p1  ORF type:complete len:199 (-),score=68.53 GFUD01005789.1:140-736(-)
MPWGSAPKCPGCNRTVYPMEQKMAADRKPFHTKCITCQNEGCRNEMTARTVHKYEGYNICGKCHESIFMSRDYNDGKETMAERKKREEEEAKARERLEKAKRERRCPECDKKTTDKDSEMLAPDLYYHPGCIKCSLCFRESGEDAPMIMAARDVDDVFAQEILEPYCKFCYAKKYKTSAIKIAEMVEIAPEIAAAIAV